MTKDQVINIYLTELGTKTEFSLCKEYISFEKITIRAEKEYRRGSMRKSNVIQFQMNNFSLSKSNVNELSYIILVSFKTESLFEQVNAVLVSLNKIKPTIQCANKKKTKTTQKVIETARNNSKLSRDAIMATIGERDNETIETNYQKFSRMKATKDSISLNRIENRKLSNKSTVSDQLNKIQNTRKQRTKSCFDLNTLTNDTLKDKSNNTIEQVNLNREVIQQKEENMSLFALLNQMLSSSSKKSQPILLQSNMKSSTEMSSPLSTSLNQTKRKEQINTIINMNLSKSLDDSLLKFQPVKHNSNININSYEQSNIEPQMLTLGRKESEEIKDTNRINSLIAMLNQNEVFIYDSFLFKQFKKEYNITNKEVGQLFTQSNNCQIQAQLLTEIIGLLSKKFLKLSIIKSLEIVLKEKEINKNYFVHSSHQHSIEYCIVDVFNSFLGNNFASKELYNKVLPRYLKEKYDIDIVLIKKLKQKICCPNLFIIMEYHSKIYFNENREINFKEQFPFQPNHIKYISPYFINKVHLKAANILSTITLFNNDDFDINSSSFLSDSSLSQKHSRNKSHSPISTTNAKRLANNFEIKQSQQLEQAIILNLKRYEELNDNTRINLVKEIYLFMCEKNYSYSLKLCDYYIQKFSDTVFLNSFVYLFLAEIYNETNGIEYSKLFIEKTKDLMNWLYPDNNCFFIADCYYTFSLIFLKQNDSYIKEHVHEINEYLNKSNELSQKYYKSKDEKSIKIRLQMIIFKLSYLNSNELLIKDYQMIIHYLDYFHSNQKYTTEIAYLDLFIDLFRNSTVQDEAIIKNLLQRIHVAKKNSIKTELNYI